MMILLEKRTFLYHLSGMLAGILYCAVSYQWCMQRFPGTGIRLGRQKNIVNTELNRQRVSEPWTRSWGYGSVRSQSIKRKNVTNIRVRPVQEQTIVEGHEGSEGENDVSRTNSEYSNESSVDGIPIHNSQSPPTYTYGGERTDERDITTSPIANPHALNITSSEPNVVSHHESPNTERKSVIRLTESSNQNIRQTVPPEPSYVSETSPPQVPVGLGGGTYLGEESQSEDENETSSYSSEDDDEVDRNSIDDIDTRNSQEQEDTTSQDAQEMFNDSVLSMEDLRRRRIERFS